MTLTEYVKTEPQIQETIFALSFDEEEKEEGSWNETIVNVGSGVTRVGVCPADICCYDKPNPKNICTWMSAAECAYISLSDHF